MSRPALVVTPLYLTEPTLSATEIYDGTVALTWNAPGGREPVTGYHIWQCAPGLGEMQLKVLVSNTNSTSTSHRDETAQSGTKCIYRVQVHKGERAGARSRPVRVMTAAVSEAVGKVAYPDGHVEPGLNLICWDYRLDFAVSGYRMLRRVSSGDSSASVLTVMKTARKEDLTYTDRGVSPGVTYTYCVQVIGGDRIGQKSEPVTVIAVGK